MGKALLDGKLMFPSDYLAAVEFMGKDVTLTIKDVVRSDVQRRDGKTERLPILHFEKTKKKLILNKTNAASIADQLGAEARAWVGHKITLYPTTCPVGGEIKDCIRVRPGAARNKPTAKSPPVEYAEDGVPIPPDVGMESADTPPENE